MTLLTQRPLHAGGRRYTRLNGWAPPAPRTANGLSRALALVSLVVLLVGVPAALVLTTGWPLPQSLPDVGAVSAVLSGPLAWRLVVNTLAIIAWLAWVQFALCVLAEVVAAVRARHVGQHRPPVRVPLGGASQLLARRLVQAAFTAATLTSVIGASGFPGTMLTPARPALAAQEPMTGVSPLVLPRPVAAEHRPATDAATAAATTQPASYPVYVVQPPDGGNYDSLWDVAERFLGDGQRWREIFELNLGRRQPDGRELTRPELIRPGWHLLLPRDATGVAPAAPASSPKEPQPPSTVADPQDEGGSLPDPGPQISPTDVPPSPSPLPVSAPAVGAVSPAPTVTAPPESRVGPSAAAEPAADKPDSPVTSPAAGGLLAAAALAALAVLRHRQRRRRPNGATIPVPGPAVGHQETQLRVLADPVDLTFVEEALRALTVAASQQGAPPDLRFVSLRADHLDASLAEPRADAPLPFVAVDTGRAWRLDAAARPLLDPKQAAHVLPLLPLLLSVGHDAEARVLVDLEAFGSLAIQGAETDVLALLAHVAAEGVLAPWAEGVEVLLVGFDAELAGDLQELSPDRVTAVNEIDAALLRALTQRVRRVADGGDRLEARVAASGPDPREEVRPPLLIVLAAPPRAGLAEDLAALVPDEGRGAVAILAPAPWPAARSRWVLGGQLPVPGKATSPEPCRLEPDLLGSLAAMFRLARTASEQTDLEDGDPASSAVRPRQLQVAGYSVRENPLPAIESPAACRPDNTIEVDDLGEVVAAYLSGAAPASVGLLGPVKVDAHGDLEPDRRARLTEIVVFLATHRAGVGVASFEAAIWPERAVALSTRNQAITRARAWLGADEAGVSWLRPMSNGTLRLSSQVIVDWDLFSVLQGRASKPGRTAGEVRRDLETAMRLVRGRTLSELPSGRYGWLAETYLEQEIPSAVIDVAHRLAGMLLADGDSDAALDVARRALEVDRYDERPWRDLLEAHHLRGESHAVAQLVDQLRELLEVELDDDFQPQTAALIERILPRRRRA